MNDQIEQLHRALEALRARMNASEDSFFATTIVSAEEQMRGWLAKIHAAGGFARFESRAATRS